MWQKKEPLQLRLFKIVCKFIHTDTIFSMAYRLMNILWQKMALPSTIILWQLQMTGFKSAGRVSTPEIQSTLLDYTYTRKVSDLFVFVDKPKLFHAFFYMFSVGFLTESRFFFFFFFGCNRQGLFSLVFTNKPKLVESQPISYIAITCKCPDGHMSLLALDYGLLTDSLKVTYYSSTKTKVCSRESCRSLLKCVISYIKDLWKYLNSFATCFFMD